MNIVPKLLFFITEDWYFCSHRLPLACAAIKAGYDVAILTRVSSHRSAIESSGIRIIPLDLKRRSLNPLNELKSFVSIIKAYRAEQPDIVHQVAMKPVLYGSIAAWYTKVDCVVNAFAGMGFLFSSQKRLAKLLRPFVTLLFRMLLNKGNSRLILQNPDDCNLLVSARAVESSRISLIRGAGVDTLQYKATQESPGMVTVLLASRMLWDKGVGEFVQTAKLIKQQGFDARFILVGTGDAENPRSIPDETLTSWNKSGVIEWWGKRNDMPSVFAQAHLVCLPSTYGEGIPKVLIEAAACGRPIVANDVPGCREIVRHNENGLLVPPKNPEALADALQKLIENPGLRMQMGARGRKIVEQEFSQEIIIEQTLELYRETLKEKMLVTGEL
jgi:glycosyltransferase involved in cell wall biosynthesis